MRPDPRLKVQTAIGANTWPVSAWKHARLEASHPHGGTYWYRVALLSEVFAANPIVWEDFQLGPMEVKVLEEDILMVSTPVTNAALVLYVGYGETAPPETQLIFQWIDAITLV